MQNRTLITDVVAYDSGETVHLIIEAGVIRSVVTEAPPRAEFDSLFDGAGGLLIPRFIDAHIHLDKSMRGVRWAPISPANTIHDRAIAGEQAVLNAPGTITDRAMALAQTAIRLGTGRARSHADVTDGLGLSAIEAVLDVKLRSRRHLDLEVVAFPQRGLGSSKARLYMEEAMLLGADIVGGLDPGGFDNDVEGSTRWTFDLATRHGKQIDFHLHDSGHLGLYEMNRIVDMTLAEGMEGMVALSHAFALGELSTEAIAPTVERLARANVAVITAAPMHVSQLDIAYLHAAGVRVGIGTDVADSWSPFGTGDVLQKLNATAQRTNSRSDEALTATWNVLTDGSASIVATGMQRLGEGSPADFVILPTQNTASAIAQLPTERRVVVAGEIL